MGIPELTPTRLASSLAVLAVALIVAGVALLVGAAWALIATGVFALVAAVVLYDPADKRRP